MVVEKIKSLAKKILGRTRGKPYTIDAVSETVEGYCVTGWYYIEEISSISVRQKDGTETKANVKTVSRDDVKKATGKSAEGFEIFWKTKKHSSNFLIVAVDKKQKEHLLPISSRSDTVSGEETLDNKSTIEEKFNLDGNCEFAIESTTFYYFTGWLADRGLAKDFNIESIDGETIDNATLLKTVRYNRPDVEKSYERESNLEGCGYSLLFKVSESSDIKLSALTCQYKDEHIRIPVNKMYQAQEEPRLTAMHLLNRWCPENYSHLKDSEIYHIMLQSIYKTKQDVIVKNFHFNKIVSQPKATLIIPLYGRYDFMRYQLSKFSRDKFLQKCEVIYVVDDPSIETKVLNLAKQMEIITSQPFRVLTLSRNVGFGRANNIGVDHASSSVVVLLNSDVIPDQSGWLEPMLKQASIANTGIVGARLLYEDNSIQHDGMAPMKVNSYPGILFNDHPRKGWPETLAKINKPIVPCELITAACYVLLKENFISVGGFSEEYILGDFEDSDLCLKMLELGKINYIFRDLKIYHLERQSQNLVEPGRWKHNITVLNAIYFNKKWKASLEELMEVQR